MISSPTTGSSVSTPALLLRIWSFLSRRRRSQLCFLLLVMLSSGVAELMSLGAVLPFLGVLSDPQLLWKNTFIRESASRFGWTSPDQLLIPATLIFALLTVFAAIVRLSNLWLNGRLAAAVGSDLSIETYRRTLYQPYIVHLQRNSAEVIEASTTQISLTVAGLNSILKITTSAIVSLALLFGLIFIDAPLALLAFALFGTAYLILMITSRRRLRLNGVKITKFSALRLKALQEGIGAIRDVILEASQLLYVSDYSKSDRAQRLLQAENTFISSFPRFALEALGMISIAFIGWFLVSQRGSGAAAIPLLGALALGSQRLLPALQQIYGGWASIKSYNAAMQGVISMLEQPIKLPTIQAEPLVFNRSIRLESVCFEYDDRHSAVLRDLSFEVRAGENIGLIGNTGCGKSTVIDLIMGLLLPSSGKVLIDGKDLNDPECPERLLSWRASIAHVPQNIYLSDNTIAQNIAFGVPHHQIDFSFVKQAAEQAQIANFIESTPEGYNTFIGERGVRLSGGQRQRLGIARALYKKSRVLILDEATSALDNRTEESVMSSINSLSKSLTVIMIAHRLSTIERCDRVIRLEQGGISAVGSPRLVLRGQI